MIRKASHELWRARAAFAFGVGVGMAVMVWLLYAITLAQREAWVLEAAGVIVSTAR